MASDSRKKDVAAARPIASWRVAVVQTFNRLPAPVRRWVRHQRRVWARLRRRRREQRGDYSLSRPALFEMDRRLEELFGECRGFFVEAGANDGYRQSNTYSLERVHGWQGLLVEPVPALHREAVRERPGATVVRAALVSGDYPDAEVELHYRGEMTVVTGLHDADERAHAWHGAGGIVLREERDHKFTAPARTLSSLLDDIGATQVDLVSLDVEGYEAEVLGGLDVSRHSPRFILVEVGEDPARRKRVDAVLADSYVCREDLSPYDVLYARRSSSSASTETGGARREALTR